MAWPGSSSQPAHRAFWTVKHQRQRDACQRQRAGLWDVRHLGRRGRRGLRDVTERAGRPCVRDVDHVRKHAERERQAGELMRAWDVGNDVKPISRKRPGNLRGGLTQTEETVWKAA